MIRRIANPFEMRGRRGPPVAGAVLGILLTSGAGPGARPVIIAGVLVAYLVSLALSSRFAHGSDGDGLSGPRAGELAGAVGAPATGARSIGASVISPSGENLRALGVGLSL